MGLVSRAFYFFTPYTDARERAVSRFFRGLNERHNRARTRARLARLLQRDIAVINLWTEYRYKGYTYLDRSRRRALYANLQLIAQDFDRFYTQHARPAPVVLQHIQQLVPAATPNPDRAVLLQALADYFSPKRKRYEYRISSSFGRLLRDPAQHKLVGDCNQIVTLYMYIYSRYFALDDLRLRVLPEHVALHYAGIDIETTNGTFINYAGKAGATLLPAEEIVSINLLDTTDSYLATHEVTPEDFLQASRLAAILSYDRTTADHNLHVAYNNLVTTLMHQQRFARALQFAQASRDRTPLNLVGHNGAIYELERHRYASARRYAEHALEQAELVRTIWLTEGSDHYQAHRYHDAIKAFKHTGDQALIRRCYEGLFFAEQAKLPAGLDTGSVKQQAKTIRKMHLYAKRSGNKKLIAHTASLRKHL